MLNYFDLRKGVKFLLEDQPYEVLDFQQIIKAQDATVIRTKVKNLLTGKVLEKTFHKGDKFEETESEKTTLKFLYGNRGKYVFCEETNTSKRIEFTAEKLGDATKYLVPNTLVDGVVYDEQVINITLPIKIRLKVTEAAPGVKGNRAQSGTKTAVVETGAEIQVPLFVVAGDVIEVNTETGEYTTRV
jgi:elongation factor P